MLKDLCTFISVIIAFNFLMKSFLDLSFHSNNTIDLQWNFLTCGYCKNFWLIRDNSKLKNRIIGNIECRKNEFSNPKPFWDEKDFVDCKIM
jgi:hypothetical protein